MKKINKHSSELDFSDVGITVMAYSRPDHIQKLIYSLQQSEIKKFTVFVDGPDNVLIREQQKKIFDVINKVDWAVVDVIKRPVNLGLRRSIVSALTEQFLKYEKVILIEDDCIPDKDFFYYMIKSLDLYKNNDRVRSVCGYQLPLGLEQPNNIKTIASSRFIPWGWGTWRDQWQDYETDLIYLHQKIHEKDIYRKLPSDIRNYLEYYAFNKTGNDIWSINWVLTHYATDTLTVYPSESLINNIGFDGSGVHCTQNNYFDIVSIDTSKSRKFLFEENIELDHIIDRKIIDYMENKWGETMVKAPINEIKSIDSESIDGIVTEVIESSLIFDLHTHLFPYGTEQCLSGIDELLTYHYLTVEAMGRSSVDPKTFLMMNKLEQARFVWDVLFRENTPISEASRGILNILNHYNIESGGQSYDKVRSDFNKLSHDDDEIFNAIGVSKVVMTNDPFDANEWRLFDDLNWDRERYVASIRLDQLFSNISVRSKFSIQSYDDSISVNVPMLHEYLDTALEQSAAIYAALSVDGDNLEKYCVDPFLVDGVMPWLAKNELPLVLMVGVKRSVNPAYETGGDGIGGDGLKSLEEFVRNYSNQHFLVTHLRYDSQQHLTVLARKFPNLTLFGFWWFMNLPGLIESTLNMRLDLLGTDFIPQHSDARVHEQLIYKWSHFKDILSDTMSNRYKNILKTGYPIDKETIANDIHSLLYYNAEKSILNINGKVKV